VLFPTFYSQVPLHTSLLAIPSAMSTQNLSSFLLVHLVIPASLGHRATPTCECSSLIQCLRHLASFPRFKNELASIDYDKITYHKVQYLSPSYNGDIIFEFLPSRVSASTSKNAMDGMDKRFNGHIWCHTITSTIHNS
jgi:hypothetical protein